MTIFSRLRRLTLQCTAGILGLLGLSGCVVGKLTAGDHFSGAYLEAARAIVADEMTALRAVGKTLPDIDTPGHKGMTLLWFSLYRENFAAVETLVALGSKPWEQIEQGIGSALHAALLHEDPRYLKAMLNGGLDPNLMIDDEEPILHEAAGPAGRTLEHVKLFLAYGADIDARDTIGMTPLLQAISTHRPDVALYLVEQGADVNAFDRGGVTMMFAVQSVIDFQQPGSPLRLDYERLRDRMIEKGAKYPPDPPRVVRAWARARGMDMVLMPEDEQ